jgi:hypothetical protein
MFGEPVVPTLELPAVNRTRGQRPTKEITMNEVMDNAGMASTSRRGLLPLLALLPLAVAGIGANSASAAAAPAVPFKADVSGSVSLGTGAFTLAGQGKASHLGMTGYTGSGVFTGPLSDTLTETLTAANGDTLTILCQQVLEDLGNGMLRGADEWTVIGGTGRFAGATGSGSGETFVHGLNTASVTFNKHITGSIAY